MPAVAVKETDAAPAATDTEGEVVKRALSEDSITVLPAGGAARFSVTVQVVDASEFTSVRLQLRAETSMGLTKLTSML